MRVSKGLVLGLVGALLAGAAQAVGEQAVERVAGTGSDPVSITVPPGHVGDRVAYAYFIRHQGTDPWEAVGNWSWRIDSLEPVPDRFGALHQAVHMVTQNWSYHGEYGVDGGPLGRESSVDMVGFEHVAFLVSNRTVLLYEERIDLVYHTFGIAPREAEWNLAYYGPVKTQGSGFPGGAEPKFMHAIHQGVTYSTNSDIRGWAANLLASSVWFGEAVGNARSENLRFSARVGDAVLLDGVEALPLSISGCIDWVSGQLGQEGIAVHFLARELKTFPATVCFDYTEWVTASSAYPVRTQTVTFIDGASRREDVSELVGFEQGERPIPWGAGAAPVPSPPVKRSPTSQRHPADGDLALPYPLSEALQAINDDPTLLQLQIWKNQHPDAILAGGVLTPAGAGNSRAEWNITFGSPQGRAFVVSTSRADSGGPATNTEIGEVDMRPFTPDELPAAPITLGTAAELWDRYNLREIPKSVQIFWGFGYEPAYVDCSSVERCKTVKARVAAPYKPHSLAIGRWDLSSVYSELSQDRFEFIVVDVRSGEVSRAMVYDNAFQNPSIPVAMEKRDAPLSPHAVPGTPSSIDLAAGALLSTSLMILFLSVYFFPVVKFLGTQFVVALPGYAKTEKGQILNHRIRETLAHAIRSDPGITAPQLQALTGAGWTTIVYHLRLLEKNKIVSSLIDGRHKRYFPTEAVDWRARPQLAALANLRTKELYEALLDEPGQSRPELAHRLGISRPAMYWHLDRLERTGLVGRDNGRRNTKFYAVASPPREADPRDAVEVA